MAEKRVQVPIPGGPVAQGVEIDVSESNEKWSQFVLEDGSVIRVKPSVLSFIRIDGQYDTDGNPVYAMKASLQHVVMSVPEDLRKKVQ
jgi:hypothetical protein